MYTPDGYMSAQLARPGPDDDDQGPDAYAIAYSGPYDVDEQARTVAHEVRVSAIPSWLGTTQVRQVRFPEPDTLVLSAAGPRPGDGVMHDDDQLVTPALTVGRDLPVPARPRS